MPKCIELLTCDWVISILCYQAIEKVHLIKWPVSVYKFLTPSGLFYIIFFAYFSHLNDSDHQTHFNIT